MPWPINWTSKSWPVEAVCFMGRSLPITRRRLITTYANYRSELAYGRVDGTFAGSVGDLKIVMGASHLRPCGGQIPQR